MSPFVQYLIQMSQQLNRDAGIDAHIVEITLSDRAWWAVVKEVEELTPYPVQVLWHPDRESDTVAAAHDCIRVCGSYRDTIIRREPRQGGHKTTGF